MKKEFNKRKKIAIITCLVFVITLVGLIGSAFAYMYHKTETITNEFGRAIVACEVVESFNTSSSEKSSIKVKNTGNIDAYLRVSLVSWWEDSNGNIVGKASEMPDIAYNSDTWVKHSSEHIYFYKSKVSPEDLTGELLQSPMILKTDTYNDKTVYQVVQVFAEAIQSKPTSAVTNVWSVSLDSNRDISTVN